MLVLDKYGFSSREVPPQGTGAIGVLICGEAPGAEEDEALVPFCPWAQAGSVLERAIMRIGMRREQFVITNVVPFRPPNNWLEGAPWCQEAIIACEPMLRAAIERYKPRAILALGGIATRTISGLAGDKLGVTNLCGYLLPSLYNVPVVPCFHPSYLRRGKMSLLGVMMRCIKLAVAAAKGEVVVESPPLDSPPRGYVMWPSEARAMDFVAEAADAEYLAYDIETPWSVDEEVAEEAEGEQRITSIQFSTGARSGIYFPWREPYIEVASRCLGNAQPKLGWNNYRFDDPIIRGAGLQINGEIHDLMWAAHHLQPDLPRGLQFQAGQMGWPWPWKHVSHVNARFYGITDAAVLQWMITNVSKR